MNAWLERAAYVVMICSAIFLSILAVRRTAPPSPPSREPALAVGDQAPPLTVVAPNGMSEPATTRGRSTLVVFFATGCGYCLASLPVYRELAIDRCDLSMSFVVRDREGEALRQWWTEHAWEEAEACAAVTVGAENSSSDPYGVAATPTHVLVGPEGRVLGTDVGSWSAPAEWLPAPPEGS